MNQMQRVTALSAAFSPSAPIDQQSLFSGRMSQLLDVVNAINQKGQHAILFGERGVGKTSLARVISRGISIQGQNLLVASINCDPSMTFSSLWHQILREITITTQAPGIGFLPETKTSTHPINHQLPQNVSPDDIRHLFSRLPKSLIVIDELDRLSDENATALLSDTIKTLSDHAVDVTLLLVGVADSVDALIKEHQSVERALVQIRMPRMSKNELFEIVEKGIKSAEMTIDEEAKNKIAILSQGLPHYTHLLSLNAGQRAAMTNRNHVELSDVRSAIDSALARAQQSIISAHHLATSSSRDNLYPQVLLACALSHQDSLGYFTSVDVRGPLSAIMKRQYDIPAFSQHLNAFCDDARGPILQKTGTTRRFRFRFCNPLMQPFVIMDGIKRGLITEASIK